MTRLLTLTLLLLTATTYAWKPVCGTHAGTTCCYDFDHQTMTCTGTPTCPDPKPCDTCEPTRDVGTCAEAPACYATATCDTPDALKPPLPGCTLMPLCKTAPDPRWKKEHMDLCRLEYACDHAAVKKMRRGK